MPEDRKYLTPAGYWIRVQQHSVWFRAMTNDLDVDYIEPLAYRGTREEAQADLDALAVQLGLEVVSKFPL